MTTSLHRIFVYGTLRRGQPNHYLLLDSGNGLAKWLGVARLAKKYPLVVATRNNMPALLDKEGEGKVMSDSTREKTLCTCVEHSYSWEDSYDTSNI